MAEKGAFASYEYTLHYNLAEKTHCDSCSIDEDIYLRVDETTLYYPPTFCIDNTIQWNQKYYTVYVAKHLEGDDLEVAPTWRIYTQQRLGKEEMAKYWLKRWRLFVRDRKKKRQAVRVIVDFLMPIIYSPWIKQKGRPGLAFCRLFNLLEQMEAERKHQQGLLHQMAS